MLDKLSAPFPKEAISWRAQSVTQDGKKAMALAYIDARDVMNRLDDVCGLGGWQCKYSHAGQKTICDIGIKVTQLITVKEDGVLETTVKWIWRADGAGDSDVEAEKGAMSDAFKRAAVRFGIGRYLYDLDAPWVPCETYEKNGKLHWKKWSEDPWKFVKSPIKQSFEAYKQQNAKWQVIKDEIIAYACEVDATHAGLSNIWYKYEMELAIFKRSDSEIYDQLVKVKDAAKGDITNLNMMKEQLGDK